MATYRRGRFPDKDHYTEADDPKSLIALDTALNEVTASIIAGHLERAAARCRDLVRKRPDMGISRLISRRSNGSEGISERRSTPSGRGCHQPR